MSIHPQYKTTALIRERRGGGDITGKIDMRERERERARERERERRGLERTNGTRGQ